MKWDMDATKLGIDIGSTNVKVCWITAGGQRHGVAAHEGNLTSALTRIFDDLRIPGQPNGLRALVTGTEGRHRLMVPDVIAPVAVERGLEVLGLRPRAVVSMGGEDLVLYVVSQNGRIVSTYSGNKCASGTGEFFRQQLGRMNLTLNDLDAVCEGATVYTLSARCSVFMKSDCTHRLNKGEATKGDIALSLSKVMADKVSEFLTKARITDGEVVAIGGVAQNRFLMQFLHETWPNVRFVVPEQAAYFEAFGAAHLAAAQGTSLPTGSVIDDENRLTYDTFLSLAEGKSKVRYVESLRGQYDPDAEYILGVDGGSTTTKIALVNAKTHEVVASHYGRTHGDPVAALKTCIREIKAQLGDGASPRIKLAATTGSSRELLGVFLETGGVYNEIIAHTVGTTYFQKDVDTIFEIGGQDAKYVFINNAVPIDYAMNEACSAGTGSFLEESAHGDLSINSAPEIGPIALQANAPLKFGEHCSAFINSDIRKGISQGATREDIVAGLVYSIVANYLNRVVGNRTVGDHIVLQGGVAKNPAVPLAFARMTGKEITVPPDPELMGCFGVALLAQRKAEEGFLREGTFDLDEILESEIIYKNTFTCKACENYCDIRNLSVGGHKYPFGGRCSKYTNARKKKTISDKARDYTEIRAQMLFDEYAPDPETLVQRTDKVVGVPKAFSIHSLWPFYAWFFHSLGVRTVLSTEISPEGIAKQESNYCYPAEIAHGTIQNILDEGADYVFLPHFRDMPSMEQGDVHACTCPLTQGMPYFARQAFGLPDERSLKPVVSFKHGWHASQRAFEDVAEQLGFTREEGAAAYRRGLDEYHRFTKAYRELGKKVLAEMAENPDTIYVALLGRPYNAFTRDANMGVPRKFTSQGVTIVPFDMLYDPDETIFPYMYWYYGQENMKAVGKVKKVPNLYLTWISNFSCAPDSFMLHYVRWMMGQKPYLILEMDSHTADAGLDTRVEAFLDIVESYRRAALPEETGLEPRRYRVEMKEEYCDIVDTRSGEKIDIRDERVVVVWPSMGELGVQAMATASNKQGVNSVHLPVPNVQSTQLARNVASGKECIPALLVLGSALQFFQAKPRDPNKVYLLFVPATLGPCRTGQYHVFYDRLFEDMGWENVVLLTSGAENSYRELGEGFSKDTWRALVLADYFQDARLGIRLLAEDVQQGLAVFSHAWGKVLAGLGKDTKALGKAVAEAGRMLAAVPKRRSLDDIKKVMVVGEIYVRRDDFSIQELTDFLISRDIFPKVGGVTEWFHYTDYARKYLMQDRRERQGILRVLKDGGLKEEAWFHVEAWWKNKVEQEVRKHLMPTGLVPDAPHDMQEMIENGRHLFVDPELESEACVSPAVAAAGMQDGYSGVAIIAPFACLVGRLIEGVYSPWAKKQGYPVIALENDGQPYPPGIMSRMEVFAHNVSRFDKREARAALPLVPDQPPRGGSCQVC
jgi:predicted CoA-substrate-specific enzyme activase